MKAKLYEFQEKMEIKFTDETIYYPKKGEVKEAFVERIKAVATDDYLDDEFELVEINHEVVATNSDEDLQQAFLKAEGLQKKLIESVLIERNIIKGKKPPREKIEAKSAEDMKASEDYKDAESKIGQYARFSPFKKTDVFQGKIVGVALNKTNTIIYFTIVCDVDNKRRCCGVLNETLEYIDAPEGSEKVSKAKSKAKAKDNEAVETESVKNNKTKSKNQPEANLDDAGDVNK